jgi:integrase
MTVTDDPEHKYERTKQRIENADFPEKEKELIYEFLKAIHPEITTVTFTNRNGKHETKSVQTTVAYGQSLKRVNELSEKPLSDFADTGEVNELFNQFLRGTHPNVKDGGYSKQTMGQWQSAVTKFFEHYDEFGIGASEIAITAPPDTSVDERDMFSRDDVEAMRDAANNSRDRCLLELFLNTGQRVRAIQTLRVKDVDTEEGIYYLNTDELGLKGANKNGKKRPLLGAQRPVYDWLKEHQGNPEDYLITTLATSNRGEHGEMMSQDNIRSRLKAMAETAGVEKPTHPHNFRHYFVTACKRDYGMDNATIKHLIGHDPGSKIMETTYAHLSDEDHIKEAELAAGVREEQEDESPLTPQVCPTCAENLPPDARACPGCGTVFAPDARAAEEKIDEAVKESYKETDPEDTETVEEVEAVEEALDDPDVMNDLLENDKVIDKIADKVAEKMSDK